MKRLHIILGLVIGIIIISTILLIPMQNSGVASSSGTVLSEFRSSLNFNVYVSESVSQLIDLEAIKKATHVQIFDISSILDTSDGRLHILKDRVAVKQQVTWK